MRATPFLMFQGNAEEAVNFYIATVPDTEWIDIERYGDDMPHAKGTIKLASFSIAGQRFLCIDSPVKHAFTFTPATSIFLDCDSEEEIGRLSTALVAEGGAALMPLNNYGFSRKFAWINDHFGVSWQLNLA
ncbi:MAG: VOC family protein [Acidobacteria bacterium]|nr:VOC family protein [Acidobacteriota bacterium]